MDDGLREVLGRALGAAVVAAQPVHGGDVALAYRIDLDDGRPAFAKTHRDPPPRHFSTEASGLSWLADADAVPVPAVLAVSDEPPAHLVLEWVERGAPGPGTEAELGRGLAALHRAGAPCFGREDRRTTGSRGLPNEPYDRWSRSYAENRLRPLARLAREERALPERSCADLERVADRLDEIFPTDEPPARLHGDLWAGNRLVDRDGRSWLIDPAAHGGHREHDLAMMRLFGGFGPEVFAAYEEVAPLEAGWEDRVALHQLAPLAVHAIKFGGAYGPAVRRALDRWT